MIRVTIEGVENFQQFIAQATPAIQKSLDDSAALLADMTASRAKQIVPVRTGTLQRSITAKRLAVCWYAIESVVIYAPFVEFGTMFMRPQPFLRPAILDMAPKWGDYFVEALRLSWRGF